MGRLWNIQIPSQPKPGPRPSVSPCTVAYLFAEALVPVPLVDARPVAAEFLVGAGAAVVGVLRAVDPVEVGRAVTPVRAGHVLAGGPVLFVVTTIDQHSLSTAFSSQIRTFGQRGWQGPADTFGQKVRI